MATIDDRRSAASALSEDREEEGDQGRIGYGRLGRFTPLALAALLVVAVAAIGFARRGAEEAPRGDGGPTADRLVGAPAPDATLTLLDGHPLRLADLRGSVVVLNFWASWCAPCRDEMPLLQELSVEAARTGEPVAVVGVGVRTDRDDAARALVHDLGLTYPLGRDTATDEPGFGPIQRAFALPDFLPATVVLRPDGVVDRLHLGPLTAEGLREAVDAARTAAPPSSDPTGV